MMSDTPRVFVGTTAFLVSGLTSDVCLRKVNEAIDSHAGVRVVDTDVSSGLITVNADLPVDRADLAVAICQAGYSVLP